MAKKGKSRKQGKSSHAQRGLSSGKQPGVGVRQASAGHWQLVHPRCARERADDLEEVDLMISEGEADIAIDELRWLLSGCSDFILAHRRLGELVLAEDNDVSLARAHFGHAYQLGNTALRRARIVESVPYSEPANQAFFEAGKGLAFCLIELKKPQLAKEVLERLLVLDPTDPLGLRGMLEKL